MKGYPDMYMKLRLVVNETLHIMGDQRLNMWPGRWTQVFGYVLSKKQSWCVHSVHSIQLFMPKYMKFYYP